MGTHTQPVSKNIAISDEVYERLKREKGDKSFSELIAEKLDQGTTISEVTGTQVLTEEIYDEVTDDIAELSTGTLEDDETA